jgi:hypothetical protein
MLGAVTTSLLTGQLISRTGRYRWNVVFGPLVLAVGMYLLSRMDVHTTSGEAARDMVIAGIGIGSMMQVFVISVQNAVSRAQIGAATALTQFSRQMGATIGVTIIGAIVNHGLPASAHQGGGELSVVHRLPPAGRRILADALHPAFLFATAISLVAWVIAVVFVKEQRLRRSLDEVAAADASAATLSTAEL